MTLIDEVLDADDISEALEDKGHKYSLISKETIVKLSPNVPIVLSPEAKLAEAIALMQEKKIGAILVTEGDQLKGIFTERDALFRVLGKPIDLNTAQLKDYMTPNPVTLELHNKIAYALNQMTVGGFRHIPIVKENGDLFGVISVKDIVEYLANLAPEEVYNLRPKPLKGFSSVEGG